MQIKFRFALASIALSWSATSLAAEITVEKVEDEQFVIITVSGEIEAGDEEKFRRASLENSSAIVWLNSDGGALAPALSIGRMLRLSEYPTIVAEGNVCASSCALIWLAGSPRFLSPKGMVGFHASYYEEGEKLIETGVGNAMVGHYLSQLNLSERAVIFATSASPDSISWLDASNQAASGIFFEVFGEVNASQSKTSSERGSLDSLFKFSNPARCEMTDQMLSVFRNLVQIDQNSWQAYQGKPVTLPGFDRSILPSFSRNREASDGYDAREVTATLPINADWLGLPVTEIQYVFFEQSSNYEYRIFFDAAPEAVHRVLNRHGFNLPSPGTPRTFDSDSAASYGMGVFQSESGSIWLCGSRMFY